MEFTSSLLPDWRRAAETLYQIPTASARREKAPPLLERWGLERFQVENYLLSTENI